MEMIIRELQEINEGIYEEVKAFRRHFHQYPELSFREKRTSQFICDQLDRWGIPYHDHVGGYGVVGLIKSEKPNEKTIALRADMDALPIQEMNDVPYASQYAGVMHACGHDVHSASLLGTAYILNQFREHFHGQIKLIFQPAEERLPGGASLMIRDGVLENPNPATIIAQHVHPPLKTGTVGFRGGRYMASTDEIYLRVRGKGGHGAMPHKAVDAVLAASHIVVAMQQIISRRSDATIPSVLTFGKIMSENGSTNVLPDEVRIEGTFRSMDEDWRKEAHDLIKNMALYTARAFGAEVDVDIKIGYPVLINDPATTERLKDAAIRYLGKDQVFDLPLRMSSEDFAYYSQERPSCFYRLGVTSKNETTPRTIHSSTFDVDEECLRKSPGLMAFISLMELNDSQ